MLIHGGTPGSGCGSTSGGVFGLQLTFIQLPQHARYCVEKNLNKSVTPVKNSSFHELGLNLLFKFLTSLHTSCLKTYTLLESTQISNHILHNAYITFFSQMAIPMLLSKIAQFGDFPSGQAAKTEFLMQWAHQSLLLEPEPTFYWQKFTCSN